MQKCRYTHFYTQKNANFLQKVVDKYIIIKYTGIEFVCGGVAQLVQSVRLIPVRSVVQSYSPLPKYYGLVVKRLIHRPFTAESGVRFPSRSPRKRLAFAKCFFTYQNNNILYYRMPCLNFIMQKQNEYSRKPMDIQTVPQLV